jgi:DNA repair exonuclease SbcCD nuclease subunit
VVTHAPLYPPGKELEYEYFPAARWAEAMGGAGYCFYGHVHEPHGTWECGGVTFCNNGALSRGSLHEYNLTRQVGCTIWSDESGEFEFVPLDAPPASEVFRLTEKKQVTDMQGRLDSFLEDIGGIRLDSLSPESVLAHIKSLGLGKPAETLAEELLAEAQGAK